MKVTVIPAKKKQFIRAGIYARVSTAGKAQLRSLSAQVSALTRFVYEMEHWHLKDVYMEVVSGKETSGRTEFQRMLQDCENKQLDYVVAKSVERFGRDTVDVVDTVRKIRNAGAQVYFQRENIDTARMADELSISLAAAIAQAENETRSMNIRQGLIYGAENGTSGLYRRKCFGYDKDHDGNLVVNQTQAEVVKKIFRLCIEGNSIISIRNILFEEQIPTPGGELKFWSKKSITDILKNLKYTGTAVIKPNSHPGCRTGLANACPVIITEEMYNHAQEALENRTRHQSKSSD